VPVDSRTCDAGRAGRTEAPAAGGRADLKATVELFKTLPIPAFDHPTEYVALKSSEEYAFYDGDIASSEGWQIRPQEYLDRIKDASCSIRRVSTLGGAESIMVGAGTVQPELQAAPSMAAAAAKELGLAGRAPIHS